MNSQVSHGPGSACADCKSQPYSRLVNLFVGCAIYTIVCVAVLRPSRSIRVMYNAVSLINHIFACAGFLFPKAVLFYFYFSPLSGLSVFAHILSTEADDCPFTNQHMGENDCRKYFMVNICKRMLPDPAGIKPITY